MKIEGNEFYLLYTEEAMWISSKKTDAIDKMKEEFVENEDLKTESTRLWQVNVKGKEWKIKQAPWPEIANKLLGKGSSN